VRVERFQGSGRLQLTATVFGDTPSGACMPNDTTLCLLDGRFSVNLDFTRPGEPTERARVDQREDQWGTFAFFATSNIPNGMVTMGPRPNGFLAVQVSPLQAAALEDHLRPSHPDHQALRQGPGRPGADHRPRCLPAVGRLRRPGSLLRRPAVR
jgi:hypothetical protein